MAANVMEKSFLRRGMPTTWQERKKFLRKARRRGRGGGGRYPYPQLSSIPGLPSSSLGFIALLAGY
jgi:hypothetical protein